MTAASPVVLSIITSSYNDLDALQRTARVIADSADVRVQWVVVDGGSTDGTAAWLQAHAPAGTTWMSELDQGIYDAWNKGLRLAKGEWLCFVGAGDFPMNLREMLRVAGNASDPLEQRLHYGPLEIRNASGEPLYTLGEPWERIQPMMRQVMRLPHPSLLHHRSLFDECGGFDVSYRIAGDYELLLRCLRKTQARFHPGEPWVAMHLGGISTNPTQSMKQLEEVRRAQVHNGILHAGPLWKSAVWRVRVRLLLSRVLPDAWVRALLDWGRKLQGKPAHWTKS